MTTTTTRTADPVRVATGGPRVARLLAVAFGLSMAYTVLTTALGKAPSDFDATTPTVWIGYVVGWTAAVLALREQRWARRSVTAIVGAFLVAAVLVYPRYFTAEHQDTLGWFENDAYVALLTLALYEHLRRPEGKESGRRPRHTPRA